MDADDSDEELKLSDDSDEELVISDEDTFDDTELDECEELDPTLTLPLPEVGTTPPSGKGEVGRGSFDSKDEDAKYRVSTD